MAITILRPNLTWWERLYLPAIVGGLAITLKHFTRMLLGRTKVTMQYPEQRNDVNLPDYYRGAPALVDPDDKWFATIGHKEDNPITLAKLSTFFMSQYVAAHKSLEKLAARDRLKKQAARQ